MLGKVRLLPEEPAGKIFVKNAGMFEVRSFLSWRSTEEIPDRLLREISFVPGLRVLPQEDNLVRRIEGKLSVFDEKDFDDELGSVLRNITNVASVSEAVLKTKIVKVASPGVPDARVLSDLARYLWEAGVSITFGRTEFPLFGADVTLGTDGSNGELESVLLRHGSWETSDAEL